MKCISGLITLFLGVVVATVFIARRMLKLGLSCLAAWRRNCSTGPVELQFLRFGEFSTSKGPPLVICHGLFGHKTNWKSVSKALSRQMNRLVYAVDLRNHGESPWTADHSYKLMAEDVSHFVEKVVVPESGEARVDLLGHSMGGKVASTLALSPSLNPRLRRLVVEDIAVHRPSSASLFLGYVEALSKVDLTQSRAEILDQLELVIPEIAVRQFLLTNLVREQGQFRWKMNLRAINDALSHVLAFTLDSSSFFAGPTMFIYGQRSAYFLESDMLPTQALFPQVQFVQIPKSGHWIHAEQPELFMKSVTEFLF